MNKRKAIPEKIQREVYLEAGFRCAIPTCRETSSCSLEIAHINPVAEGGTNNFYNLILLCTNCHRRFDSKKEKHLTREQIINVKKNLMVINGKYSHYEMRILQSFVDNAELNSIRLADRDIDVMYLVNDGLLKDSGTKIANAINQSIKVYLLTEEGRDFINKWKNYENL